MEVSGSGGKKLVLKVIEDNFVNDPNDNYYIGL